MPLMISIRLKFFAYARELVGRKEITFEIESDATVKNLMEQILMEYPSLREIHDHIIIAVNKNTCKSDRRLKDGDEVAILPPVSGG